MLIFRVVLKTHTKTNARVTIDLRSSFSLEFTVLRSKREEDVLQAFFVVGVLRLGRNETKNEGRRIKEVNTTATSQVGGCGAAASGKRKKEAKRRDFERTIDQTKRTRRKYWHVEEESWWDVQVEVPESECKERMKCNKCFAPFQENAQVAINRCNHVFCVQCAKEMIHTGEGCSACGASVMKTSIKVVVYRRDSGDARHMLCGQSTDFIVQCCISALQFQSEQKNFEVGAEAQQQIQQQKQDFENFQQAVKSKLTEIHSAYKRYKGKCSELAEEQASLIRDRAELQDKYAQKSAQARRLQEMCENLQNENQKLRKMRGAPFFDARPQEVSEGSYGHRNSHRNSHRNASRQQIVPAVIRNKKIATAHGRTQPEAFPKTRATSEVSSFHAPPRATLSTGFRASKKRIFEIASAPSNTQWEQQWTINGRSSFKENAIVNLDPFETNTNPIEFLN